MAITNRFVVKEVNVVTQYLGSFTTFAEAKNFADSHDKPTLIYELLYDGQVEHGPI